MFAAGPSIEQLAFHPDARQVRSCPSPLCLRLRCLLSLLLCCCFAAFSPLLRCLPSAASLPFLCCFAARSLPSRCPFFTASPPFARALAQYESGSIAYSHFYGWTAGLELLAEITVEVSRCSVSAGAICAI